MVRPRLTLNEIEFLRDSLKHTLYVLDMKEQEYKELESKVWKLRKEIRVNPIVFRELKEAKQQLEQMKSLPMRLIDYRAVCNSLIRRFDSLLDGGRLHSYSVESYLLEKIYGTKKV